MAEVPNPSNKLIQPGGGATAKLPAEQLETIGKIQMKFAELGINAKPLIDKVSIGPMLTAYRYMPFGATKVSHMEALGEDLAITLGVEDVLVKRMPGESAVGVFVPNKQRSWVTFRDTINAVWCASKEQKVKIPLNMGMDWLGKPVVEDLAELPHLLVAGSTGTGKSTWARCLAASIVYTVNTSGVKLVISDTKGVEYTSFARVPHMLFPIATTVYQTMEQLEQVIRMIDARQNEFAKAGCLNIHEWHGKGKVMPFIVVIIDELADILLNQEKNDDEEDKRKLGRIAEHQLGKITQRARFTGIHLIASTQRPSVDVIRGSIKANFPARLSFRLPSEADSRTVLAHQGAEHLMSKGDMLFVSPLRPGLIRLHAPLANATDIQSAIDMAAQRQE